MNTVIKRVGDHINQIFGKKIVSIFFAEPQTSITYYLYNLSSSLKEADSHLCNDKKSITVSKHIKHGVFIFAEGEMDSSRCFYFSFVNSAKKKIYIKDSYWKNFVLNNYVTYFHVSYGANIINKNAILKNKFPHWVAYSSEIITYKSKIILEIDMINKFILEQTYKAALSTQSPSDFIALLKEINIGMKEKLIKSNKIGHIMVASIGHNMTSLTGSFERITSF